MSNRVILAGVILLATFGIIATILFFTASVILLLAGPIVLLSLVLIDAIAFIGAILFLAVGGLLEHVLDR